MLLYIKVVPYFENMILSFRLSQKVHTKNHINQLFFNDFKEFGSIIPTLKNTHDCLSIA